MFKKQIKNPKSTSVISVTSKKKPKGSQTKKVLSKETKQIKTHERMCPVNEKIHFNNDVPGEVQDFIKKISTLESDSSPSRDQSDDQNVNLLEVKDQRLSRRVSLPCSDSEDELVSVSRKPSIHVIVTADYSPNNLSNNDYDKLKQVKFRMLDSYSQKASLKLLSE